MSPTTRRQLLARGGVAAGAAALPSLALVSAAFAQESDETDALEPLIELEQGAELAYSLAAEEAEGEAARLFGELGTHAGEHATALSEALDQLGVDPPDASEDPATYDSLGGFDAKDDQGKQLSLFISIEQGLIAAYESATPKLEAPDLVTTGAQIAASHAQALVALRLLDGRPPASLTALPDASSPPGDGAGTAGKPQGN